MKMKKVKLLGLLGFLFLLVSCRSKEPANQYQASRMGNEDQFRILYETLNSEDHQVLILEKDDEVECSVRNESGEITVEILNDNKDELIKKEYKDEDTDDFIFKAPKNGEYIMSVTGKDAKGLVLFVKKGK